MTGPQNTIRSPCSAFRSKASRWARLIRETSAPVTAALPGRVIVAVDAKDEKGETAAEPLFLVELELPDNRLERVGARAEVRFDLGYEPAGSIEEGLARLRAHLALAAPATSPQRP